VIKEFPLPTVRRIRIKIPKGMKVVNWRRSRLTGTDGFNVTTAAVHGHFTQLLAFDMLDRARREGQLPVDSIRDLENILTRGLWVDCNELITGIELRKEHGCSDATEFTLVLWRSTRGDNHSWSWSFSPSAITFGPSYQVLGLAKR